MMEELSPQALREDIDCLLSTITSRHPNPFYYGSEQAFRRHCQLLWACAGELSPAQRLAKLLAIPPLLNDGHTRFRGIDGTDGIKKLLKRLPLGLYWFHDGLHVRAADPGNDRVIVLKYDSVRDSENGRLADKFEAAFRSLDTNGTQGLIVDLRKNGGGDNRLNWPLIDGIKTRPEINKPGRLFALVGRGTCSAAVHCAVYLERHTRCIFAGEPTGSSPNHFGDALDYELPNTKLTVRVSSLWWQESLPYDSRTAITPQLRVEYTAADYARGHDAGLALVVDQFRSPGHADHPSRAQRV